MTKRTAGSRRIVVTALLAGAVCSGGCARDDAILVTLANLLTNLVVTGAALLLQQ
ncbi:MAG: hypothetical protein JXQ73_19155 [Phycisphaerae bacterium]|nr:hypothetical protein [Phycisphaerae bacterium]